MRAAAVLLMAAAARGDGRCCESCAAPLQKYYSVDVAHGFCGEACMDPKKIGTYKIFEKNLTKAADGTPCAEQFTPNGTHYTVYDSTVTHGVPGILAVTLDLYAPGPEAAAPAQPVASPGAVASGADPFAPGTYAVASAKGKMPSDIKWTYNVWAPDAEGSFPVIVFVTGGGGVAPGTTYSKVGGGIAAKGAVFIALSRLAAPAPNKDAALLGLSIPWLQQNLPAAGLKAAADWGKLALSGHSAGNHVICSYLQSGCGIAKAAVMIDPVDGYDPFGIEKIYCITPGQKTNFTTPALLLRTELDPVKKFMVACAPDKLSNQRFYDAWSGPIWEVNATGYGHLAVNDDGVANMGKIACAAGKLPKEPYYAQVAGLTTSFLSMVFGGDAAAEQALLDATAMPVANTIANHDYNGHTAPFTSGCTNA